MVRVVARVNNILAFIYSELLGSDQERADIKKYYIQQKGSLYKLSEYLVGYDIAEERRYRDIIQELIDEGLEKYPAFANDSQVKREKHQLRVEKDVCSHSAPFAGTS